MKTIFTFLILLASFSAFSTEFYTIVDSDTRKAINLELEGKMINAQSENYTNCSSKRYGKDGSDYQKKLIFNELKSIALSSLRSRRSTISYRKTTAETTILMEQIVTDENQNDFLLEFTYYLSAKGQLTIGELRTSEATYNENYYIGSGENSYFIGDQVDYLGCSLNLKSKL